MSDWDIEIGEEAIRAELSQRFGGGTQGGIQPSASTANIFVFTDPAVGRTHGYDYDGWIEKDTFFQYTGEGRVGDQRMDKGNRAILNHRVDGRALRVFAANGIRAGTKKTVSQLYIGQFELDSDLSCFVAEAPDDNGDPRSVFVFRLRPIGEALVRDEEQCSTLPPPLRTEVEEVEVESWSEETDVEESHIAQFERGPLNSLTARRTESELVGRYKKFLESQGHEVKSRKIHIKGSVQPLRVDLFDNTTDELCEAKGSATRVQMRYAIGQILDYSRHVDHKTRSILLPVRPAHDLIELAAGLDIACVYETSRNSFERTDTE